MLIRRKEIVAAVTLSMAVLLLTIYLSMRHAPQYSASLHTATTNTKNNLGSIQSISPTSQAQ